MTSKGTGALVFGPDLQNIPGLACHAWLGLPGLDCLTCLACLDLLPGPAWPAWTCLASLACLACLTCLTCVDLASLTSIRHQLVVGGKTLHGVRGENHHGIMAGLPQQEGGRGGRGELLSNSQKK